MRKVYQTAQRVIIWLGPSDSHIDCLFDWMTALDQHVLAIARPHTFSTWESQWLWLKFNLRTQPPLHEIKKALSGLLQREWFSRIWVLQEAALARSAIVSCGRKECNSRAFVVMPSLLKVDCGDGERARLDILPGLLREKSWWADSSSRNLLTLLQKFGRSKASDPRDIIYALLGLSGDSHSSEFLRPNYQISVKETVQRSVAYFMLQTDYLLEGTPIRSLPNWGIDELLDKLHDLTFQVFKWATDYAQDALLFGLIRSSRTCMGYVGIHGPPITIAIKKANSALVELLLTTPGMDVKSMDSDGMTPMSVALGRGNTIVARLISEYQQGNIYEKYPGHNGALLVAGKQGSPALRKSFPESPQFVNGAASLLVATKEGDRAAVESILIHSHVDMSIADVNGDGPLNLAARKGDEDTIDLLLQDFDSQQALRFRGSDGLTPLESAVFGQFPRVIKKLLIHMRGAVHYVVEKNQFGILRMILDADPRLVDSEWFHYKKPLSCAAETGNTEMVSMLLEKGAKIDSRDCNVDATTPLWKAASNGHLDTVKVLVEKGADIELRQSFLMSTPVWAAAGEGYQNIQVVMYLLKAGAHIEVSSGRTHTFFMRHEEVILWAAICGGLIEVVRALVETGGNLEFDGPSLIDQEIEMQLDWADNRNRATPIWIAASLGHADIVSLLIRHGADIEARDTYYGMTPFLRAAQQKRSETMEVLKACGADTTAIPIW